MIPVIHMIRWKIASISFAKVETCSGRCSQNGSALAVAGASAAPKTKSAGRRARAARANLRVLSTAG